MKYLFAFLILLKILSAQTVFDVNNRWINEKGWPIPDENKMKFEKGEVLKDIIPEWICKKIYAVDEKETYSLKLNKIEPNFRVSNDLVDIDIHRVSKYYFCDSKDILFFVVSIVVVEERDPDYGISGDAMKLIFADLNQDGIYESLFNGADINPNEPYGAAETKTLKYFAEKWRSQRCTSQKTRNR